MTPTDELIQSLKRCPRELAFLVAEHQRRGTTSHPIDEAVLSEVQEAVQDAINKYLTERQQLVIRMRYCRGHTLKEVGVAIGVGKERVRQIEGRAERELRIRCPLLGRL